MPSVFVLLIFLVLADGAGLKNIDVIKTGISTSEDKYGKTSLLMSAFLISFLMFLVGCITYVAGIILGYIFPVWFPSEYADFIDICTLANFSVVMFDEDL